MKVYGTPICIDCRNYHHDPIFAPLREKGGIGVPLFVREDGAKTFDRDEALSWIGQPPVREEEIVEHRACDIGGCR